MADDEEEEKFTVLYKLRVVRDSDHLGLDEDTICSVIHSGRRGLVLWVRELDMAIWDVDSPVSLPCPMRDAASRP